MSKKPPPPLRKLGGEITDLTVCRALFAAWVFIYHIDLHAQFAHYLGPAAGLIRHGYLGVDGFFILSGLILARVHLEFNKSFHGTFRFWVKRLIRIYPVHLVTILILVLLAGAGHAAGVIAHDPDRFSSTALVQNLLLVHGWGFDDQLAWNYPSWSVSSEWAGYILFPLICFLLATWPVIIAAQIVILCIPILGLLVFLSDGTLNITSGLVLLRFFMEFIAGAASARLIPVSFHVLPARKLAASGLVIVLLGAAVGYDLMVVIGLWLVLVSFALLNEGEAPALFGKPRVLHALGLLSYSFYMSFAISELLLAQLYRRQSADPAAHKLLYSFEMTAITFVLSGVLYFIVERPCRRFGDRFLRAPDAAMKIKPLAAKPARR